MPVPVSGDHRGDAEIEREERGLGKVPPPVFAERSGRLRVDPEERREPVAAKDEREHRAQACPDSDEDSAGEEL